MNRNRAGIDHLNDDNKIMMSLNSLVVRLITPGEENNWNNLTRKHHYLCFHSLTGKTFKYVALLDGDLLFTKATTVRNGLAGRMSNKTQRLNFIVNNLRF